MSDAIPGTVVVVDDGRLEPIVEALRGGAVGPVERVAAPADVAAVDDIACVLVADGPHDDLVETYPADAVPDRSPVDGVAQLDAVRERTDAPVGIYVLDKARERVVAAVDAGADTVLRVPPTRPAVLAGRVRGLVGVDEHESVAQRYRSLLEHYPESVYLKDTDGRFVDNTSYALAEFEDTRLDRTEARGLSDYELFAPALADELFDEEQALLAGHQRIQKRIDHYVEDGEDRWVSTTKVPRYDADDELLGLVGDVRDVTHIKRRERMMATLHEATRRLVRADDRAEVGEIAVDIATGIDPLPRARIDLVAPDTGDLATVAAVDGGRFRWEDASFRRARETGTALYRTAQGAFVPVDADCHDHDTLALPDGVDAVSGLRLPLGEHGVFGLDAEAGDLDPFTIELAHVLAGNVEAALDRAEHERQLLAQADRLEEFPAIGAHELRNRLQIAMGNAERARALEDPEAVGDVIDTLARMDRLVSQLLTLARTGATSQATSRVALSGIAKRAWQDVDSDGATLDVETDGIVTANRDGLIEVFEVLFRTATRSGDGTAVRVGTADGGFYVADDATTIPDDQLETLFEPTYSEVDGGIGDSVYLVSVIADAHDWAVDARSDADGTRFSFSNVAVEPVE